MAVTEFTRSCSVQAPRTQVSAGQVALLGLKNYVLGPLLAVVRLLLIAIVSLWLTLFGTLGSLV